jgi:hypothetical protein
MMQRIGQEAPPPRARTIGVTFLFYFLTATVGGILLKGLVVSSDAVATANNILAHEPLYRSGVAVGLIANASYIVLTALLYGLFAPVSRSLSLLAAFFSLLGCALQIFAGILQIAPLTVLADKQLASAFTVAQLRVAALLSLKLYAQTFHISFVLFGLFNLVLGYLIYKSTFLPRVFGVLFLIAGIGWLTFLWPPLATSLWPAMPLLGGLAEIGLMVRLLAKGVDISRWQERVGAEEA